MAFHARDAAIDARATVNACLPCLHRKTMEKQRNRMISPVKNYYCMSDISCLHQGDRLKTAFHCFYRAFIVNNSTLGVIPSVILNYLSFFKHFACIISEHIICIRKVCTRCSCACIFSAKIFSDLFNINIMMTTSCVLHLEYNFL